MTRGWKQRARRYLAQHPECETCGAPATDVDHIMPRPYGSDDDSNLMALCHRDHARKTALVDGWARRNARRHTPQWRTNTRTMVVGQW